MVVPRDGKGVRGVEGRLRYRGVEAWKEWTQAHHPFGQEAVEECALREGKNYLGILGYTEIWPHTHKKLTIQGLLVSFPVCHGLGIGPNTYLSWC